MTGQKTYKEQETEKQKGKKRYLERIAGEREADSEIDEFKTNSPYKEEHPDYPTERPTL